MATSTEETTSVVPTPEVRVPAEILLLLSKDNRAWSIEEEEEDAATDDDDDDDDDDEVIPSSTLLLQQATVKAEEKQPKTTINEIPKKITKKSKKSTTQRINLGADDSDETLMIIQEWNQTEPDQREKIFHVMAEKFSKPIKKQLTFSDVKDNQSRLMLGKHQVQTKMFPLLEDSEIPQGTNGLDVSVYGPDGVVQNMKFKMWSEDTPVLTSGWKKFVAKCDLRMHCDFLTIWMFRHSVTRKICFAIDKTRYPTITRPLGRRIMNCLS